VRQARQALGSAYEALLFHNYRFAQSKEVEQSLWKSVCYR
jgi:hypothetical protein